MLIPIALAAALLAGTFGSGTTVTNAGERRAPLPELQDGWSFEPDLDGMHSIGSYVDAESGAIVMLEIGSSERARNRSCPNDPGMRVSRGTSGGMPYCQLDIDDARAFEIEAIRREIPNFDPAKQEFRALSRELPAAGERYLAVVFLGEEEAWFFYSYYAERRQRVRILDLLIEGTWRASR